MCDLRGKSQEGICCKDILSKFTKKGQKSARALTRARVLLLVHKGEGG